VATAIRAERKSRKEPLVAAGKGRILDANGRRNEREVWGRASSWCDYSGTLHGNHVGVTLFCHPDNPRPSWFHARDGGLLTANLFGRAAFRQGPPSKITVAPGKPLRLRYGIFIHAEPEGSSRDLDREYAAYVREA
jgi:hypothetical protein